MWQQYGQFSLYLVATLWHALPPWGAMEAKILSFPQISFQQLFSNLTSVLFSNRNSHQCAHVRFSPACGKVRDENLKMPFPSSAFSPGW